MKIFRLRWILPVLGLTVFSVISYSSFRWYYQYGKDSRIFMWSSLHLDSDPLNRHPRDPLRTQCTPEQPDCVEWEPISLWVEPGFLTRALMISAFPAFIVGAVVVHVLGRLGVSEVTSFMISMPILIFAWFYQVGKVFAKWGLGLRAWVRGRNA